MDITSGLANQVSDIFRKQMQKFFMLRIPVNLPNPQDLPKKTEATQLAHKKTVSAFLDKWIPILYGVQSYDPIYRHACLTELVRWSLAFNLPIASKFSCHWYWELDKAGSVPERLAIIAHTADIIYTIMRTIHILPKNYTITRF